MTCLSTEELAALYDGALPGKLADSLREHLARCPRCANEIKQLSELLGSSGRPARPAAGAVLRARQLADSPTSSRPQKKRPAGRIRPVLLRSRPNTSPRGK